MAKYAYLDGSTVEYVLVFEPGSQTEGGIEVTDETGPAGVGYTWDGAAFVPPVQPVVPVTIEQVKSEAERRILALCPEWRQRNLTAQAVVLAKKGATNWTTEEQAAWDAGEALWTQIKAIRDASDVIEAMDPIPQDYTADGYWP